jgi:hypothetical protein
MEGGCTLLWRLSRVSEILQPPPLERWERGQMACRQVTTSDGEFFPVKARLLRPCLALTSAVQVRCCCCCLRRCLGASRRFPFRTCAPTTAPSRRANQTLVPDATQFYYIFIFILNFKSCFVQGSLTQLFAPCLPPMLLVSLSRLRLAFACVPPPWFRRAAACTRLRPRNAPWPRTAALSTASCSSSRRTRRGGPLTCCLSTWKEWPRCAP